MASFIPILRLIVLPAKAGLLRDCKFTINLRLYQSMVGHLRIKSPWSQLAVFIGLTCLAYLVAGIATLIIYKSYGIPISTSIQKMNWNDPNVVGAMKTLQALSSVLIFLFPVVLFALLT